MLKIRSACEKDIQAIVELDVKSNPGSRKCITEELAKKVLKAKPECCVVAELDDNDNKIIGFVFGKIAQIDIEHLGEGIVAKMMEYAKNKGKC